MKIDVTVRVYPSGEVEHIEIAHVAYEPQRLVWGMPLDLDAPVPTSADLARALRDAADQIEASEAWGQSSAPQEPPSIQSDEGLIVEGSERLGSGVVIPGEVDEHDHKPVQHRDGKPPWCNECGLTEGRAVPRSVLPDLPGYPRDWIKR